MCGAMFEIFLNFNVELDLFQLVDCISIA